MSQHLSNFLGTWNVSGRTTVLVTGTGDRNSGLTSQVRFSLISTGTAKHLPALDEGSILIQYEPDGERALTDGALAWYPAPVLMRSDASSPENVTGAFYANDGDPILARGAFRGEVLHFYVSGSALMPTLLRYDPGEGIYAIFLRFAGKVPRRVSNERRAIGRLHTILRYLPERGQERLVVVLHVCDDGEKVLLHRSVFQHGYVAIQGPTETDESIPPGAMQTPARADSQDIASLEGELADLEQELASARDELEELSTATDDSEAELLELELQENEVLATCWETPPKQLPSDDRLATVQRDIAAKHMQLAGFLEEADYAESNVDQLEDDVADLEDRIDSAYRDWEETAIRQGREIVSRALAEGSLVADRPWTDDFIPQACAAKLSAEARDLIRTCAQLFSFFRTREDRMDRSPLITQMSKCCERVFSDAFSGRRSRLLATPSVSGLISTFKRVEIEIPELDRQFKIDKSALRRVIGILQREEQHWSGTRNCGIALLLFGRQYSFGVGDPVEIDNPLGIVGTEDEAGELRRACYELQKQRNGFAHHALATWDDVERVHECFQRCLKGLLRMLYAD